MRRIWEAIIYREFNAKPCMMIIIFSETRGNGLLLLRNNVIKNK
jgi:hypothetical protein